MELDKLITVIKSYRVAVREEKNPDVLSQIMVELATYTSELGDHVPLAELEASQAKASYEVAVEQTKKAYRSGEDKVTVADAETIAKLKHADLHSAYLEAQYSYKMLRVLWEDAKTIISVKQSRLSDIRKQMA